MVRTFAEGEGRLGRKQQASAGQVLDRLAQNLLGKPLGVDIGRVKKVDASFHAEIDEPCGFGHVRRTPSAEKLISTAKRRGAKAKHRNLKTTLPQLSEFHSGLDEPPRRMVATFSSARADRQP